MFDFRFRRYNQKNYEEDLKQKNTNALSADEFKNKAQQSLDAKTQALYNYLFEIAQTASLDGRFSIIVRPSDETALIFRNKVIRTSVVKMFKEQHFKIKIVSGKDAHIWIGW